jgi:hypothetical protein
MKGYKTIIFNAVMLFAGIFGAEISPDLAGRAAEAFVLLWGVGNVGLRAVTDSPIFRKGTP